MFAKGTPIVLLDPDNFCFCFVTTATLELCAAIYPQMGHMMQYLEFRIFENLRMRKNFLN